MAAKKLWTEAYRPKTLDGYVFQNEQQRDQINRFVLEKDIPQLLLTGTQGSGKTTLAEILINELEIEDHDVLRINASDKTGVDFIRDNILNFASSYPIGRFKIVKLEEFDYMSPNAQGMLRAVLEESTDTCRFVCTCNFENKIIAPLKSRMQHLRFKAPSREQVVIRMVEILVSEEVEFDDEEMIRTYVDQAYPDIRKIINNLQLNTNNGKLGPPTRDVDGGEYQFKILDLIAAGNFQKVRDFVVENLSSEQIPEVIDFIYKNAKKHPVLAKDSGRLDQVIVILGEAEYRNNLTAIPHLNFEGMCIKIMAAIA